LRFLGIGFITEVVEGYKLCGNFAIISYTMAFNEQQKLAIKRRAHFMCCLCHNPYVEVHHITPEKEGGPNSEDNAAPLCPYCHETFGSNPTKRKFIKQARDSWYEICEKRYSSDPERLEEIANQLKQAATKKDLENAVNNITALFSDIVANPRTSPAEATEELSDITASMSVAIIEKPRCYRCGYAWESESKEPPVVCPRCKSPYWDRPRRQRKGRSIFISYQHKDQMKAKGFNLLSWAKNVDVDFVGRHLLDPVKSKDEQYIKSEINKQIKGTSVTVVLIGKDTKESEYQPYEIERSLAKEAPNGILGIKLNKSVDLPKNSPTGKLLHDAGAEIIDWEPNKFGEAIDRAADASRRAAKIKRTPPPPGGSKCIR